MEVEWEQHGSKTFFLFSSDYEAYWLFPSYYINGNLKKNVFIIEKMSNGNSILMTFLIIDSSLFLWPLTAAGVTVFIIYLQL